VAWETNLDYWPALRFENGDFYAVDHLDVDAREKWFFRAIAALPAMFRRAVGADSLYWLGLHDADGAYLDGVRTYRLSIPQPVPGKLFWSISVYDAETRSQIRTDQNQAALRSLFELADAGADAPLDHYFGPQQATSGQSPANRVLSCGVTSGERTNGMTARPPTTLFARLGQRDPGGCRLRTSARSLSSANPPRRTGGTEAPTIHRQLRPG
jgi:Protein of unknown function (DUF1214)